MTRFLLALVLLSPLSPAAASQSALQTGRDALSAAVHAADAAALLAARAQIQIAASGETAGWAAYYTALADYRLAYAFWGTEPERAARHAQAGADALAALRRGRLGAPLDAEAAALHAALLSARIGLDPAQGMALGPASQRALADAVRLDAENPRVMFVEASSLLNTPPEWGGDPDRALALLQGAVAAFEASGAGAATPEAPAWGHADAASWLALAHLMRGDWEAAREPLATAERLDPNSAFVRYKLKPWLAQLESDAPAAAPGE